MAIEIYGVTMRYLMQHLVKNKQNEKQLTPSLIKADKSLELGDVIQNMPSYDGDKTSLLDSISNACTLVLILVFWLMSESILAAARLDIDHEHRVRAGEIRFFPDVGMNESMLSESNEASPSPRAELMLVTCYPFNAMKPGGNKRFIVLARA
jgi:hypothetical protein